MHKIPNLFDLRDDANLALLIRQVREGLMHQLERELTAIGVELNYTRFNFQAAQPERVVQTGANGAPRRSR